MSLSENDRVMLYGNRTEKLPTLAELSEYLVGDNSSDSVSVDDITGISPDVETLLKAEDAATARAAIGAGTSNLALGTTATTALAGNANAVSASKLAIARDLTFSGAATGTGSFDGSQAVDFELTLAPVAATNVNIEEDVVNGVTADTLQATISALAARIQALEDAATP